MLVIFGNNLASIFRPLEYEIDQVPCERYHVTCTPKVRCGRELPSGLSPSAYPVVPSVCVWINTGTYLSLYPSHVCVQQSFTIFIMLILLLFFFLNIFFQRSSRVDGSRRTAVTRYVGGSVRTGRRHADSSTGSSRVCARPVSRLLRSRHDAVES